MKVTHGARVYLEFAHVQILMKAFCVLKKNISAFNHMPWTCVSVGFFNLLNSKVTSQSRLLIRDTSLIVNYRVSRKPQQLGVVFK